eukprot:scaffold48064_cov24-Tisochrysis_lutea.AAC.1
MPQLAQVLSGHRCLLLMIASACPPSWWSAASRQLPSSAAASYSTTQVMTSLCEALRSCATRQAFSGPGSCAGQTIPNQYRNKPSCNTR